MKDYVRFGISGNGQIKFDIEHIPGNYIDYLIVHLTSGDNQDFHVKTTFNCITAKEIDEMCNQLSSLKGKLKHERSK